MNFVLGDQVGLLKELYIDNTTPVKKAKLEKKEEQSKNTTQLTSHGKIDRERAVLKTEMYLNHLFVLRNHVVEILKDMEVVESISFNGNGLPVGMGIWKQFIYVCLDSGILCIRSSSTILGLSRAQANDRLEEENVEENFQLEGKNWEKSPLCVMRQDPSRPWIFATGGNEQDIKVYDLKVILKSLEECFPGDADVGEHSDVLADEKAKVKQILEVKPNWQGKNVPNDYLDMRVPIWINDLQWKGNTIFVATYKTFRIYLPEKQRRPVELFTFELETNINHFILYKDTIILSDKSGVVLFASLKGNVLGRLKGIAGAVTCLAVVSREGEEFIAVGGLDRKFRLYQMDGRRELIKEVLFF